jgi:hypothetical protein
VLCASLGIAVESVTEVNPVGMTAFNVVGDVITFFHIGPLVKSKAEEVGFTWTSYPPSPLLALDHVTVAVITPVPVLQSTPTVGVVTVGVAVGVGVAKVKGKRQAFVFAVGETSAA